MGSNHFHLIRRLIALALATALFGQAALADAAVSTVWGERRRPGLGAASAPLAPSLPALPRAAALLSGRTPPGFSFASAIPAHLGTLRSTGSTASRRTVLLIQDVHLNPEAQSNIAGAVASLLRSGGVALVGLEGAEGPLGLEKLLAAPSPKSLALAADFLLRRNLISGAARAAIEAGPGKRVIGLDDAALHAANADAYRRAAPTAKNVRRSLDAVRAGLARRKKEFNPELRAFDEAVESYRNGATKFSDHAAALASSARRAAVPVPASLSAFVTMAALEKSLDSAAIEKERSAVINRLAHALDAAQAQRLLDLGNAFRAGLIPHAAFYAEFGALCRANGIGLAATPALAAYLRYIEGADRLDPDATLRAAGELETTLYAALARTGEERRLTALDRRAYLASRLATFEMTRPEWEEWTRAAGGAQALPNLDDFESFYARAVERDAAMAARLIAAMDGAEASSAAVVAGGFHSDGLVRRLAERGIATAVFTPAVKSAAGGSDYLSVFTREKSSVEKLLEGRALFLAQHPIPAAATFNAAHLAAAHAITTADNAAAQVPWVESVTGFDVSEESAADGRVSFEETDASGRNVRVRVEGVRDDGFDDLPVAEAAVGRRWRWTMERALRVVQWRFLILASRLLRGAALLLEPAPLTMPEASPWITDPAASIDKARAGDWPQIENIRRTSFTTGYIPADHGDRDLGEEDLRRDILLISRGQLDGTALVVRKNRRVVGYVVAVVRPNRTAVTELVIIEEEQNRGFGKALFAEAVKTLLNTYPQIQQIEVSDGNRLRYTSAIARRFGFKEYKSKYFRLLVTAASRAETLRRIAAGPTRSPQEDRSRRRLSEVRRFVSAYPDKNILGIVVFGGTAAGTAEEDSDLDYLMIKADGVTFLAMDESDMAFHSGLSRAVPYVEHPPVSPLILKAALDQSDGASFEMIIRMFFLPAELSGARMYNARVPGAPFIQNWVVVARTPDEEQTLTALIEQKMADIRKSAVSAEAPAPSAPPFADADAAATALRPLYDRHGMNEYISTSFGTYAPSALHHLRFNFANVRNAGGFAPGSSMVDLGSGDGRAVVFAAMMGVNARGFEGNPAIQAQSVATTQAVLDELALRPNGPRYVREDGPDFVRWMPQTHGVGAIELILGDYERNEERLDDDVVFIYSAVARLEGENALTAKLAAEMRDGTLLSQLGVAGEALPPAGPFRRIELPDDVGHPRLYRVVRDSGDAGPRDARPGGVWLPLGLGGVPGLVRAAWKFIWDRVGSAAARVASRLGAAWRTAVVEIRRTLNPRVFLTMDHRNHEFLGLQKRVVALAGVYAGMIWIPFKIGLWLAVATSLDPSAILLISLLSVPLANIAVHGTVNTAWLFVEPVQLGFNRLSDRIENAAMKRLALLASNVLQPAPLTIDNNHGHEPPSAYEIRLRAFLEKLTRSPGPLDARSVEFHQLAEETETLIAAAGPREQESKIPETHDVVLKAWARVMNPLHAPFEEFLSAYFLRRRHIDEQFFMVALEYFATSLARHDDHRITEPLIDLIDDVFRRTMGVFRAKRDELWARDSEPIRILEVTPEVKPFRAAGGMGVVTGSLPSEVNKFHAWATTVSLMYDDGDYDQDKPGSPYLRKEKMPFQLTITIDHVKHMADVYRVRRKNDDGTFADFYFLKDRFKGVHNTTRTLYAATSWEPLGIKQAVFLAEGALQLAKELHKRDGRKFDAIRAHDWQAALAPVYMRTRSYSEDPDMRAALKDVSPMVFFHNLNPNYRGEFDPKLWPLLGLDDSNKQGFAWERLRRNEAGVVVLEGFNAKEFNIGKAAAFHAGPAKFVPSRTYGKMIPNPEYGFDMHSAFEVEPAIGILNGGDYSPRDEKIYPEGHRSVEDFREHRRRAKIALLVESGLWPEIEKTVRERLGPDHDPAAFHMEMQKEIDRPIFGAVVRLDPDMKGIWFYKTIAERLSTEWEGKHIRFVVLGSPLTEKDPADPEGKKTRYTKESGQFVEQMQALAKARPDRVAFFPVSGKKLERSYSDIDLGVPITDLKHLVQAADVNVYPSKVEPCGLADVESANFGAALVVSDKGGFADKMQDIDEPGERHPTGVVFRGAYDDHEQMIRDVERLLNLYYNDRPRFEAISINNKNLRFTMHDMAREHVQAIAAVVGRTDVVANPEKPVSRRAPGAVAAWRAIGLTNPVLIGIVEGGLSLLAVAGVLLWAMPVGPEVAGMTAAFPMMAGLAALTAVLVSLTLWLAHYFGGVIEADGTISLRDARRAASATLTAASAFVGLPLLLIPFLTGDASSAIYFFAAAVAIGGLAHGGLNAVITGRARRATEHLSKPVREAAQARLVALSRDVAKALVERAQGESWRGPWASAMKGNIRAQAGTVGVAAMAERPLPSLAPMESPGFDQPAFLSALRVELETMGAVHKSEPAKARSAAESVAFSGLIRVTAGNALDALDSGRLHIVVFDGMREKDAARAIARLRANPKARAIVVHDPANKATAAFVEQAGALENVRLVAAQDSFEMTAEGGRKLVLRKVESRLAAEKALSPSIHVWAGKGLEIDTEGLDAGSPFRAALYTILDALLSVTAGFNRMSLLDASYKLIASQA